MTYRLIFSLQDSLISSSLCFSGAHNQFSFHFTSIHPLTATDLLSPYEVIIILLYHVPPPDTR